MSMRLAALIAAAAFVGASPAGAAFSGDARSEANRAAAAAVFRPVALTAPGVSGTLRNGETLTASLGTWARQPASFAVAWERCDGQGACAPVGGATGTSYTLTSEDVGRTLRVRVTARNGGGSTSQVSAPAGPVTVGAPRLITSPTVTGRAAAAETLTATPGVWQDASSVDVDWLRCDVTGATCSAIAGATTGSYRLTPADVASTIRVRETARNTAGEATGRSAATAAVTGPPDNTALPAVRGTAQDGATLTATLGDWRHADAYAISWVACNSDWEACGKVAGSGDTQTLLITSDLVGRHLSFQVTASNAHGSTTANSVLTAAVASASGGTP